MKRKNKFLIGAKRLTLLGGVCLLASILNLNAQDVDKLPTTEILGQKYYIYETQKGESLYGIAYKFGWDIEELARLNPESTSSLRKGRRLYYPLREADLTVNQEVEESEIPSPEETISEEEVLNSSTPQIFTHKVKKGESVYGISRQYGISLDEIYAANPSSIHGVKTGEELIIPQSESVKYTFYTVKEGDTLASLSKQFNTRVEDILKDNPGLTEKNFAAGETLRLSPGTFESSKKIVTEVIAEERVSEITDYKVDKNDTWETISEKTGVDQDFLKEVNSETENLKKNQVINIPKVETIEIEKQYEIEEELNLSSEDIQNIYDSIHGVTNHDTLLNEIKVAILLDDPNSKRDIDFTRGFLVSLSENPHSDYKVDLKVIDGRVGTNELLENIEDYEPNLIISTADKAFPAFLADYGNENNAAIINAFDLKNDLYEDNSSLVQLLLPTSYFSEHISDYIFSNNEGKKLLLIGDLDSTDAIGKELAKHFGENTVIVEPEKFKDFKADPEDYWLIYPNVIQKDEVTDFFKKLESLKKANPKTDISIIGRTNWAALVDRMGETFAQNNVEIPARVWLDENSDEWKRFNDLYAALFDGHPVRSIPNYAASGYDIASYFLPVTSQNGGDFNLPTSIDPQLLQSSVLLQRVNNWGGFINMTAYILKFNHSGEIEKILIQ